jgi:hypothetical protein
MSNEYLASPRASTSPFMPVVVALVAATTKTVLQVATPSTTDITVLGWQISFDGISGSAIPVVCQLIDGDVGASVGTALTPDNYGNSQQPASLCVGGTAATGYNFGTEGTMTSVIAKDAGHTHPQSGYGLWFPDDCRPRVAPSRFLRIRCLAPGNVNVIPEIWFAEPAI